MKPRNRDGEHENAVHDEAGGAIPRNLDRFARRLNDDRVFGINDGKFAFHCLNLTVEMV